MVTYAQIQERVAEALADPTGPRTLKLADDAIREAINELNVQSWFFSFEPDERVTLTATRGYTLTSPVQAIESVWYMNEAEDRVESPVLALPFVSFVRGGFHVGVPETGRPDIATYNEETGKFMLNRVPGGEVIGRKLSVAYWKAIASPPVTVDDIQGGLIVECAKWRIRRGVPGYNWMMDLQVADREKLRVRAMRRVTGATGYK